MTEPNWNDDDDVIRWAEGASREEIEAHVDPSDVMGVGWEIVPPVRSASTATIVTVEL